MKLKPRLIDAYDPGTPLVEEQDQKCCLQSETLSNKEVEEGREIINARVHITSLVPAMKREKFLRKRHTEE